MGDEVRGSIQGQPGQLQVPPEEARVFMECVSGNVLKIVPFSIVASYAKNYIDTTFRGLPAAGTGKTVTNALCIGVAAYFLGVPSCIRKTEIAYPNGVVATARNARRQNKVLYQTDLEGPKYAGSPMIAESPMVAERPMMSEGPMVTERPMMSEGPMVTERPMLSEGLGKPESFNYLDVESHVPEFKGPDDSDLIPEQEIKEQEIRAPVPKYSYEELRQRNRERQHRGIPTQRSDDSRTSSPRTSSVETQPRKRVNQYGDIISDD